MEYKVNYTNFNLNVKIHEIPSMIKLVKSIDVDSFKKEGLYRVYFKSDNQFYVDPPLEINEGFYCLNCGQIGPDIHKKDCFDQINYIYLTIGGVIDNARNNNMFYILDDKLYEKSTYIEIIDKEIKNLTEEDLDKKTNYQLESSKEVKDPFNRHDRLVLTYHKNDVTLRKSGQMMFLSTKVDNLFFYKLVMKHIGVPLSSIEHIKITNIGCNIEFENIELIPEYLSSYIVNNGIFGPDYKDYNLQIKANKYILYVAKMFEGFTDAEITINLYKESISVMLHKFISDTFDNNIEKQLDVAKKMIEYIISRLLKAIEESGNYEKKTNESIKVDFYTLNNNLPYTKKSITNVSEIRKDAVNENVFLYDIKNQEWSQESYKIGSFIDKDTITIIDKNGKEIKVNTNMIALDKGNVRGNQVCREIHNGCNQHPVPYSFHGFCPEYYQIIDPVGAQSYEDNHFYPCCKEKSASKASSFAVSFLMNGISEQDRESGLIPKDMNEFDIMSGLFKQHSFDGRFLVKRGSEYINVKLLEILSKAIKKYRVKDDFGIVFDVGFADIHPMYRESRNFIGLNKLFNDKKAITNYLNDVFVEHGYIKKFLSLKEAERNEYNTLRNEIVKVPLLIDSNIDNNVLFESDIFIVPKNSIYCKIFVDNNNVFIKDEYNFVYKLETKNLMSNTVIDAFYFNDIIYVIHNNSSKITRIIDSLGQSNKKIMFKYLQKNDITDNENIRLIKKYFDTEQVILINKEQNIFNRWFKINNLLDSSVFIKMSKNIKRIFIRNTPKTPDGSFVKLTFDLQDHYKIINEIALTEEEYILFKRPYEYNRLNFILNYTDLFDLIQ